MRNITGMASISTIFLLACAAGQPGPHATPTDTAALTPEQQREEELNQAHAMVAAVIAKQAASNDQESPPSSLEDVEQILKRDQLDLFEAGISFAAKQKGPRAMALRGQIALAWGEALSILAEIQSTLYGELSRLARELDLKQAAGGISDKEKAELNALREEASQAVTLAAALDLVAAEHIKQGAATARAVIEKFPDNYLGYRVAADYYRMRQEWDKFDKMVAAIESINPDSNGLVFVRGVAAYQREHDVNKAMKLFRAALKKDPQFTRAQAHLLMIQPDIAGTWAELQALTKLNPKHQIVQWTADGIKRAYEASQAHEAASPPAPAAPQPAAK